MSVGGCGGCSWTVTEWVYSPWNQKKKKNKRTLAVLNKISALIKLFPYILFNVIIRWTFHISRNPPRSPLDPQIDSGAEAQLKLPRLQLLITPRSRMSEIKTNCSSFFGLSSSSHREGQVAATSRRWRSRWGGMTRFLFSHTHIFLECWFVWPRHYFPPHCVHIIYTTESLTITIIVECNLLPLWRRSTGDIYSLLAFTAHHHFQPVENFFTLYFTHTLYLKMVL